MVLSHDASCYIDWLPEEASGHRCRDWHYLHITSDVDPRAEGAGVTDEQIDQMLVENPRKIFERPVGAY